MADIRSVLLKIKALAEGTSNKFERESALRHLHRIMEKYNIDENNLDDNTATVHVFTFNGKRQGILLSHIFYKVFNDANWEEYSCRKGKRKLSGKVGVRCTTAQKIEIDFLFEFYRELYSREEKTFFNSFIYKHNLYGVSDDLKETKISEDEQLKMMRFMGGMDDATPRKQIREGESNDT